MTSLHPEDGNFERYVGGEPGPWASFEAHVGGCAQCAVRLEQEAAADMALFVLARSPVPARMLRRRRVVVAAALALAASLVIFTLARPAPAELTPFAWVDLSGALTPDDAITSAELPAEANEQSPGEFR